MENQRVAGEQVPANSVWNFHNFLDCDVQHGSAQIPAASRVMEGRGNLELGRQKIIVKSDLQRATTRKGIASPHIGRSVEKVGFASGLFRN